MTAAPKTFLLLGLQANQTGATGYTSIGHASQTTKASQGAFTSEPKSRGKVDYPTHDNYTWKTILVQPISIALSKNNFQSMKARII
jgi:hypothetical protein